MSSISIFVSYEKHNQSWCILNHLHHIVYPYFFNGFDINSFHNVPNFKKW
jgi:hypothetical protein